MKEEREIRKQEYVLRQALIGPSQFSQKIVITQYKTGQVSFEFLLQEKAGRKTKHIYVSLKKLSLKLRVLGGRHSNPKVVGILLHLEFLDYLRASKSDQSQAIHLKSTKAKGEKTKVRFEIPLWY